MGNVSVDPRSKLMLLGWFLRCENYLALMSGLRKIRRYGISLSRKECDGPRDYMRQLARRYDRRFDIVYCQDVNYCAGIKGKQKLAHLLCDKPLILCDERYDLNTQLFGVVAVLTKNANAQYLITRSVGFVLGHPAFIKRNAFVFGPIAHFCFRNALRVIRIDAATQEFINKVTAAYAAEREEILISQAMLIFGAQFEETCKRFTLSTVA